VRPLHAADNSVSACLIFFSVAIFASTLAIFASAFSRISSQVEEGFREPKLKEFLDFLQRKSKLLCAPNKPDSADNALGIKSVARIFTHRGCKQSFAFVKADRFHAYACTPRYLTDG
jgi:hypothetical protein